MTKFIPDKSLFEHLTRLSAASHLFIITIISVGPIKLRLAGVKNIYVGLLKYID